MSDLAQQTINPAELISISGNLILEEHKSAVNNGSSNFIQQELRERERGNKKRRKRMVCPNMAATGLCFLPLHSCSQACGQGPSSVDCVIQLCRSQSSHQGLISLSFAPCHQLDPCNFLIFSFIFCCFAQPLIYLGLK